MINVKIGYKYIKCIQGLNSIELDVERGEGFDAIIYLPKEKDWNEKYTFAVGRRQDFIEAINEKLKEMQSKFNQATLGYVFEEY